MKYLLIIMLVVGFADSSFAQKSYHGSGAKHTSHKSGKMHQQYTNSYRLQEGYPQKCYTQECEEPKQMYNNRGWEMNRNMDLWQEQYSN